MNVPNLPAVLIRREIAQRGVLPFDRFMELALYAPEAGYYELRQTPGRRGDFYTSVSVGELFGQLLAFQFSLWLDSRPNEQGPWQIVEAGAHDGQLARDILSWLQAHRPQLWDAIEYVILEPSPRRQAWQRQTLQSFAGKVRWFEGWHALGTAPLQGIVFGNELLDAMPARRFGWDAKKKQWFEWGVALQNEKFVWTRCFEFPGATGGKRSLPDFILQLPGPLLEVLPDGYTVESSPAAEEWWRQAAAALTHGWLLTLDYGLTADELFSPARLHGTLRAFYHHHVSDDPLARPGEQDLTTHVNFSAIEQIGRTAGWVTDFFGPQAAFLAKILAAATASGAFSPWTPKQARQFQTLTHPEHLGRAFRVLVQSR
jgi:SAM-dependent MidA family methyltransferase